MDDRPGESVHGLIRSGVMANISAAMVLPEVIPNSLWPADDPSPLLS